MVAFLIVRLVIYLALIVFLSYFFVYKIILKLLERRNIRIHGEAVQAAITDYKTLKDSVGAKRYYPVLQYTTKKGEVVTVQSKKERSQKYEIGKQLTVYYLPSEPEKFFIGGLLPYIKITTILLGMSGSLLLLYEVIKMLRKVI